MNLSLAKRILMENGYELTKGRKLLESENYLKRHGYFLVEAEEDEEEEDETDDFDEDSEDKISAEEKKELKDIVDALKSKTNYADYVKELKGLKDNQRKLLKYLVGDGPLSKDVSVKRGSLSVKILHPTQQEIDVQNSLAYPLQKDPKGIPPILKGDSPITIADNPILVYKYNGDGKYYIIDGHHRWSQVCLLNRSAKMKVILFSSPSENEKPVSMLRDFQLVIKAVTGEVKIAEADSKYNIYTMTDDAIKSYIDNTITDGAVQQWQTVKEDATKESIENDIVTNAKKLKKYNAPAEGAPRRNIMPQTDDKTIAIAARGMTNI